MKLKIEIDLDNAAFADEYLDNPDGETFLNDINREELREVLESVTQISDFKVKNWMTLRDSNGNTVGQAEITNERD